MASEEKVHKAHVLVLPYPAQGHINPMLQFSKRLVARGLRATLATTVHLAATTLLHPSAAAIAVETISDGFDHGGYAQAKSPEDYLDQFRTTGAQTLTQLITRLNSSGPRVDALIYDGFLPWALDVAQQFGLVGAIFFTQSCAVNNIYYHAYEGLIRLPLSDGRPVLVPGLPPLEPWETPSFVSDYGSYPGFYEMVVNQFSNIEKVDWVLFNSFYELEEEVVDWMAQKWKVRTIGPTLPSMYMDKQLQDDTDYGISLFKPETTSCLNWLSTKPQNQSSTSHLEAWQMSLGVPVVGVPVWTDQGTNAK
ncbi:hypothetical protein Acr_13g0008560 [Actinidia rufa]|uniref:Glycosyltransferase N-terminal domain-containing protein n=1 Tax=Actinidia rufa TaxID=165716 RepID=A0A7J0FM57_9ERIC|nr:hypothetical protein Acr_13g0008560 [Actinidia rufa]